MHQAQGEEKSRRIYEDPEIVRSYVDLDWIQKPEERIREILKDWLREKSMLDLGVGGGRTTAIFAPCVRRYVGVDFSEAMVRACQKRFAGTPLPVEFQPGDARALKEFADGSFDFVLFSYNGIDVVSLAERSQVLSEMNRVARPGGIVCFSVHNLQALPERFRFRGSWHPKKLLGAAYLAWMLRWKNPGYGRLFQGRSAEIFDGSGSFRAKHCYLRPRTQLEDLSPFGFEEVRLFGYPSGEEIPSSDPLELREDPWIYFLCKKRG